jgi:FKBP-type peptidyl-prolyl cis-trans isomerase FkpA
MSASNQSQAARTAFIEPLEHRQLLSVSPIATKTAIKTSESHLTLGQTVSITITISSDKGVPKGEVELLNNGHFFENGIKNQTDGALVGFTAKVDSIGRVRFTFDSTQALTPQDYEFSVRFAPSSTKYAVSKSHVVAVDVAAPTYGTASSDGLQIASVTAGSGATAASGDTVTVYYTGYAVNTNTDESNSGLDTVANQVFDDSAAHPPLTPFSFTLGEGDVIQGFDEGTTGMQVGETRDLLIPSAIGYSDGATRVFVIHLLSIS